MQGESGKYKYSGRPLTLAELYYMAKYFAFNLNPASELVFSNPMSPVLQCTQGN